jgi:hypothetical protein
MKKFINCEVTLFSEGMPKPVIGKVLSDQKDRVIIQDGDGNKIRFNKSKIVFFYPKEEPDGSSATSHLVLACANRKIRCEGVRYVLTKEIAGESDYEEFMKPCPARRKDCQKGCLGNLRNLSGNKITQMMDQMIFGDYPRIENEED